MPKIVESICCIIFSYGMFVTHWFMILWALFKCVPCGGLWSIVSICKCGIAHLQRMGSSQINLDKILREGQSKIEQLLIFTCLAQLCSTDTYPIQHASIWLGKILLGNLYLVGHMSVCPNTFLLGKFCLNSHMSIWMSTFLLGNFYLTTSVQLGGLTTRGLCVHLGG